MKSRREFLKTAATGAVLLGTQSKLGLAELLDQQQPHILAHVFDVVAAEPVPGADRPHQRGVALDQLVPRILVTPGRAGDQCDHGRVITHNPARSSS